MKYNSKKTEHLFLELPANTQGRDFVVGDIHGCYTLLQEKLSQVEFNPAVDRLIATGDLMDRGKEVLEVIELLQEPWFFSVQGNHERMFLAKYKHLSSIKLKMQAMWFTDSLYKLKIKNKEKCEDLLNRIENLPLVIKVLTKQKPFYVVHGERVANQTVLDNEQINKKEFLAKIAENLTWGRNLFKEMHKKMEDLLVDLEEINDQQQHSLFVPLMQEAFVKNVGLTYVGHSIVNQPTLYKSHLYIDGGAYKNVVEKNSNFDLFLYEHLPIELIETVD